MHVIFILKLLDFKVAHAARPSEIAIIVTAVYRQCNLGQVVLLMRFSIRIE